MKENNPEKGITRRRFIKTAAAALGAALLPETLRGENTENKSEKKHKFSWENIYRNPDKVKVVPDKKFNDNFEKAEKVFSPESFAIDDQSGNIFFADSKNHCLYLFSHDGKLLKTLSKNGEGAGDSNRPQLSDNAIVDGKLFVSSSYGLISRVRFFDSCNGDYINEFIVDENSASVSMLPNGKMICHSSRYFSKDGSKRSKKTEVKLMQAKNGEPKVKNLKVLGSRDKELNFVRIESLNNFVGVPDKYYFAGQFIFSAGNNFFVFGDSDKNLINVVGSDGNVSKVEVCFNERKKISEELINKKEEEIKGLFKNLKFSEKIKNELVKKITNLALKKMEKKLPYYDDLKIDSNNNLVFISYDLNEVYVYKLSSDNKSSEKIADIKVNSELGKKIIFGKNVRILGQSIYGFWSNEEGDYIFQKFDLKMAE